MPQIAYSGRTTAQGGNNQASQGGGNPVNIPQGSSGPESAGLIIPFGRAAKLRTDAGRQIAGTLTANTQQISFTPLPTTGYLATFYLVVTATAAGNAAAVAFQPDAPWNIIRNLLFRDATGIPIHNLLSGYQEYIQAKWGGYRLGRPEGSALAFTSTLGAVATGGSFQFILPIYQEFGRDTLGPLANMDASAGYQLDLTIEALANIYSVLPTNAPSFTINLFMESYTNPPDQIDGVPCRTQPPALGTTQFWSAQNYSWPGTGEQTVQIVRVGNLIRNIMLVWRTAAGARSAAVQPAALSNLRFELDQTYLLNQPTVLNQFTTYRYATYDLDTGLQLFNFMADPDNLFTGEMGERYLQTMAQTRLALVFTPQTAGSLEVLINDIAPVGDIHRWE